MPRGCTVRKMKEYILDAVRNMKSCYDPKAEVFELESDKVTVKQFTTKTKEWKQLNGEVSDGEIFADCDGDLAGYAENVDPDIGNK